MRVFDTGATRDQDETKLEYKGFISPLAMKAFAEYMHKHRYQSDGKIRDADNWQKGIPLEAYESSLIRHTFEWWGFLQKGDRDSMDEVANAMMFNLQGWIHERQKAKND